MEGIMSSIPNLSSIDNITSNPLIRAISKHHYKTSLFGAWALLLHCCERSDYKGKDIAVSEFLLYKLCAEYKIIPLESLYYAEDNPQTLTEVIESIKSWTNRKKVMVITNSYNLIGKNAFLKNTLNSLIKENLLDLYKIEQEVILTKIKVAS
jgi:hypothetical protein